VALKHSSSIVEVVVVLGGAISVKVARVASDL
jgi:hypothetical protein